MMKVGVTCSFVVVFQLPWWSETLDGRSVSTASWIPTSSADRAAATRVVFLSLLTMRSFLDFLVVPSIVRRRGLF